MLDIRPDWSRCRGNSFYLASIGWMRHASGQWLAQTWGTRYNISCCKIGTDYRPTVVSNWNIRSDYRGLFSSLTIFHSCFNPYDFKMLTTIAKIIYSLFLALHLRGSSTDPAWWGITVNSLVIISFSLSLFVELFTVSASMHKYFIVQYIIQVYLMLEEYSVNILHVVWRQGNYLWRPMCITQWIDDYIHKARMLWDIKTCVITRERNYYLCLSPLHTRV